jgi:hypothetical protein
MTEATTDHLVNTAVTVVSFVVAYFKLRWDARVAAKELTVHVEKTATEVAAKVTTVAEKVATVADKVEGAATTQGAKLDTIGKTVDGKMSEALRRIDLLEGLLRQVGERVPNGPGKQ